MSITPNTQEAAMSKTLPVQHPAVVLRSHSRNLKAALAVVLVAVLALSATVVMLASEDDGVTGSVGAVSSTPSVAKPDESKIAAGISARQRFASRPDESRVAAAVGTQPAQPGTSRPDESRIAATLGAQPGPRDTSRPDESGIAAAIGPNEESGAAARDQAYEEKIRSMTPDQIAAAYGE
jgi:hypothetical protein